MISDDHGAINPGLMSNLVKSCQKANATLTEEGKSRGVIQFLRDWWNNRTKTDHFRELCTNIRENQQDFKKLDTQSQLLIYSRIQEIASRLTPKDKVIKDTLVSMESSVFQDFDKVNQTCVKLFKHFMYAESQSKAYVNKREIDAVLTHSARDPTKLNAIQEAFKKEIPGSYTERRMDYFVRELATKELALLQKGQFTPEISQNYLQNLFTILGRRHEAYHPEYLETLKALMDKYKDNREFTSACLTSLETFLNRYLIPGTKLMPEARSELFYLGKVFDIVDPHIDSVDPATRQKLKLMLANFPCPKERSAYPNIHLTDREQLQILADGFHTKENDLVKQVVQLIDDTAKGGLHIGGTGIPRLVRFLCRESGLDAENLKTLRDSVEKSISEFAKERKGAEWAPDWSNEKEINELLLEKFYKVKPAEEHRAQKPQEAKMAIALLQLKRTISAKNYVGSQLAKPDEQIMIPKWYYGTSTRNITPILSGQKVTATEYNKAWVASSLDSVAHKNYVIALGQRVEELNPRAHFFQGQGYRRWRSVQEDIPITTKNVAFVAVPKSADKLTTKTEKIRVREMLRSKGLGEIPVISKPQLDFFQNEFSRLLGAPNLSEEWWGRYDNRNTTS